MLVNYKNFFKHCPTASECVSAEPATKAKPKQMQMQKKNFQKTILQPFIYDKCLNIAYGLTLYPKHDTSKRLKSKPSQKSSGQYMVRSHESSVRNELNWYRNHRYLNDVLLIIKIMLVRILFDAFHFVIL